jgi:indolepyruvate decarboxylase
MGPVTGSGSDPITVDALYPRWENFIRPSDIVVTETGTSSIGLAFARLPKGMKFYNQILWGAIGWATPAALGAAVAAPDRRVVLIRGEGSHQMTAQEISQFGGLGLKPTIFVLNNSGYLVERLLSKDRDSAYNDIAQWQYSELPKALGCNDWFTARVTICEELDHALKTASQGDRASYIEIVTDKYAAPSLPLKLHGPQAVDEDAVTEVDGQNRRSLLSSRATPCDVVPNLSGAGAPIRETERSSTW